MSRVATDFRPLARMGWGGRASTSFRGLLSGRADYRGQVGTVVYRSPGVAINYTVSGVTKDSAGGVLPNCQVDLFLTASDMPLATTVSDGVGAFAFFNPGSGPFYMVAYLAGAPDVAGTTLNTLVSA